ncbi:hypothetical protein AAG906_026695 [Vitis piasezkii]
MDWKRNLDIVLTSEELKWERDNYHSWQMTDQKTKCVILGSLDNIFAGKGRLPRQATFKAIMDAKMLERTHIRDHMIHMIGLFKEMEIFGAKIIDR